MENKINRYWMNMGINIFNLKIIIIFCICLKIIFAIMLPYLNDEAYAIASSKDLSLSFFDHPPVGFLSSQIFTKTLGLENPFFYRLPYILFGIATTFFIFKLGETVYDTAVGIWSALIYNVAPFFFFSGGMFVVPDAPLNLGIILSTFIIIKLHKCSESVLTKYYFILLGLSLALCFASKYQGYLFGIGCLLVLFFSNKKKLFFKNKYFYICFLLSLLGSFPTIFWNYQNEWISFRFHGSRQDFNIYIHNLILMLFVLIIYLLPQIIFIPIYKLFRFMKTLGKENEFQQLETYLIIMALPNILVFSLVFITSNQSFPHWIVPGWLLLIPIVAKKLSYPLKKIDTYLFFGSTGVIWTILFIIILHSQTGIITNHKKKIPSWDNTLELINWKPLHLPLQKIINENNMPNRKINLAAFSWTEAGQLSTLMHNKYEVVVVEGEPHHFKFMSNSDETNFTILLKLSLGLNPDTKTILKRLRKYHKDSYHVENIVLKRGDRDYATASLFLFKQ